MQSTKSSSGRTADKHIRAVLDKASVLPGVESIEDLRPEQLSILAGGVDAATYLVSSAEGQVIIKINDHGIEAEAEAINAWRKRHARVPEVLASGTVPGTVRHKKVKYLIEKALVTRYGRVVETAANYLVYKPDKARAVGRLLGVELTKMHRAVADRSFGEFADAPGNTAPYQSWNAYMLGYLNVHRRYLRGLGIGEDLLEQLAEAIKRCRFVSQGRYLHGDFSIRNAAIKSFEPLKVSVFDPNPIVGDPTWDIAVLFNNYEFQKRRLEYDDGQKDLYVRDQQLLIGFKQGYQRKIYEENLLVAQLFQAILQAQYTADKVKQKKLDKVDLQVREAFIKDTVRRIVEVCHA